MVKSDRVCSTPFAVLCFSWNEVSPKWITKEKGKVRFVSRSPLPEVCLCWLQNHGHCPWSLTIPVAAYLVANQHEVFKSLGAI